MLAVTVICGCGIRFCQSHDSGMPRRCRRCQKVMDDVVSYRRLKKWLKTTETREYDNFSVRDVRRLIRLVEEFTSIPEQTP